MIVLVAVMLVVPAWEGSASPGRTDENGGHTCWTNCDQYGLKTGEYHYHDENGDIIREGYFSDIAGHWAEENINLLYELGLINGYSDGTFGVSKSITRAEVSAIISRHLDLPNGEPTFKDVSSKHWARGAIGAVEEAGIINGYSDGSFKPNAPITRAELSVLLVRAYEMSGTSYMSFKDFSVKHWAYDAVMTLVANEVAGGYPDGTFRPSSNVTRAEFATFTARVIDMLMNGEPSGEMAAHFIDVGQGDSILLETPNGKTMLIDGGNRYAGDEVVHYLQNLGIEKIDVMVATHPDADHIGGLISVLQTFPVGKVYDSGKVHTTDTYNDYLSLIDSKDIPFEIPTEGQELNIDEDLFIKVLNSTNDSADLNDSSIVLMVDHEDVSILLTGDATVENEAEMIGKYDLRADVLKVGHHGSNTSSSLQFLEAVQPAVSILSYGDNSYGHPNSTVFERLNTISDEIFSTYEDGSIIVETGDEDYKVSGGY